MLIRILLNLFFCLFWFVLVIQFVKLFTLLSPDPTLKTIGLYHHKLDRALWQRLYLTECCGQICALVLRAPWRLCSYGRTSPCSGRTGGGRGPLETCGPDLEWDWPTGDALVPDQEMGRRSCLEKKRQQGRKLLFSKDIISSSNSERKRIQCNPHITKFDNRNIDW